VDDKSKSQKRSQLPEIIGGNRLGLEIFKCFNLLTFQELYIIIIGKSLPEIIDCLLFSKLKMEIIL
jgi:hypothetical protein